MGIQDFEVMYDTIDLKRQGYITAEQIHQFCETLYYSPLCVQHVEGAIKDKCSAAGVVTRKEFLNVFIEIERRRATEEQAYWDFQVSLTRRSLNNFQFGQFLLENKGCRCIISNGLEC